MRYNCCKDLTNKIRLKKSYCIGLFRNYGTLKVENDVYNFSNIWRVNNSPTEDNNKLKYYQCFQGRIYNCEGPRAIKSLTL